MKLFYTNASAKEEITTLEASVKSLEDSAKTSAGEIATLKADLATANESVTTLTAERDEAVAAFEVADKSLANANEKLATFDAKVESGVIARVASLGHAPVTESTETSAENKGDILAQFNAIKDPRERHSFYKANEKGLKIAQRAALAKSN